MSARHLVSAAAIILGAIALVAQVTLPRVSESIEVRITNVDVVVTDASGKRVRGLTRDDFEVFDGGKPQTITNFSEFAIEAHEAASTKAAQAPNTPDAPKAAGTSASPPPPRHVVIFFDAFSTAREDRRRLTPALLKLVRDLRPEDEAMVVSWNRSFRIVTPPTSDHAAIEKGIDVASGEMSMNNEALPMFGQSIGASNSRMTARQKNVDLARSIRGLDGILQRLAGLDGRKALILVSAAYSFIPSPPASGDSASDLLDWLETIDAPGRLRQLADAASAAGVPIYGIQAQGMTSGWSAAVPGQAGQSLASADIPALNNARGNGGPIDGLRYLAVRTGGLAAGYSNYFTNAFAAISEDLGSYYSIGYRSPELKDRKRIIEVRTRDRRYTVRARHSAVDRSPETEIASRVTSALLFPSSVSNQLGIEATVVSSEASRNRAKVPIDVKIPMANLTFQSGESELLVADLSILIGSADAEGNITTVERFHKIIPITRAQLPGIAKQHYTYSLDVDLQSRTRENRFAIAVMDNVSKATGLVTVDVKAAN